MSAENPDLEFAAYETLTYDDVLDYLADRKGEEVVVGSLPTFVKPEKPRIALGMNVRVVVGQVVMLNEKAAEAVRGGSDAATVLLRTKASDPEVLGLTVTRDWFRVATLSMDRSYLRIVVTADPDNQLTVPVGWGFTFDFDGSPPSRGRWSAGGDA